MGSVFVAAFLLGMVLNAAPGPVFAETLRQGVRGGFRPALAVQVGSLAGDALWAVLGLLGVGVLLRLEALQLPIAAAGVIYLFYLAWDAWRAARTALDVEIAPGPRDRRALRSGVLLSITNPQNIAYWAALGSALGAVGVREPTAGHYLVFFSGFMVASLVWSVLCAALVDRLFRRAGARWVRLTYRACAIAFLALALSALRDLWTGLFPGAHGPGGMPSKKSTAPVSSEYSAPTTSSP